MHVFANTHANRRYYRYDKFDHRKARQDNRKIIKKQFYYFQQQDHQKILFKWSAIVLWSFQIPF